MKRLRLELFATSFAVLFQELALIRFLPGPVRVLAYFPNLVLLSAFLGLGVGCLRGGKRSLSFLWPLSLLVLVAAAQAISGIAFTQERTTEHLWLLYGDLPPGAPVVNDLRPPLVGMFILSAASFIAPGQLVAERLEAFRAQRVALTGYAWDLLGSMAGVVVFAALSFLWTPPLVWFVGLLAVMLAAIWSNRTLRAVHLPFALALLGLVAIASKARVYSPYYALTEIPSSTLRGVEIHANGSLHQIAAELTTTTPGGPLLVNLREGYRETFERLHRPPGHVLVLGAGSGNDIAQALAAGATTVDAVEIDPALVEEGRLFHPDHPYASPRVRVHVTDARAFLAQTKDKYDLIIFGTLDSMTRLSALSSVRLDNFVYTVECMRAARRALTPTGGVALLFMVGSRPIYQRLLATVYEAFGTPPQVVVKFRQLFNTILLSGPAFEAGDADAAALRQTIAGVEPATDDWPYLYLTTRGVTPFYLGLILIFGLISVCAVFAASPALRRSGSLDLEMFLLGFAFLLLETRSVTEMALVWGVGWLTSAVVFFAILAMALGGTILRARTALSWKPAALLLCASLLASWAVPTAVLVSTSWTVRLGLSLAFVGAPVLFASILFATAYEERTHVDAAFGWNLLGAVAGGLAEFVSMSVGIKALHLIALGIYLCVVLLRVRQSQTKGLVAEGAARMSA